MRPCASRKSVFLLERRAALSFPSLADLFMSLEMCCFEVKPADALERAANGDKTPPIGLSGSTATHPGLQAVITTV